jgi:hypothetical protein
MPASTLSDSNTAGAGSYRVHFFNDAVASNSSLRAAAPVAGRDVVLTAGRAVADAVSGVVVVVEAVGVPAVDPVGVVETPAVGLTGPPAAGPFPGELAPPQAASVTMLVASANIRRRYT